MGDGTIFGAVNRVMGPDIPKGFPRQYTQGLRQVELFNPSTVYRSEELVRWQEQHGQSERRAAPCLSKLS